MLTNKKALTLNSILLNVDLNVRKKHSLFIVRKDRSPTFLIDDDNYRTTIGSLAGPFPLLVEAYFRIV